MKRAVIEEAKTSGKAGLALSNVEASWFDLIIDGGRDTRRRPQAVATLEEISATNVLPVNVEMFFWMMLGDVDRALAMARRLEEEGGLYELELIFTDEFAPMRQHPEFAGFIEAIGLRKYWTSRGCAWSDDRVRCQ